MGHGNPEPASLSDAEAVGVPAGTQDDAITLANGGGPAEPGHLLHLPEGGPADRTRVGAVPGWPRGEHEPDPATQIRHGGEHPTHRPERSVGEGFLLDPVLILPPIAVGQPGGRDRSGLQESRRHAEWLEDVLGEIAGVRHLRHVGHDPAEDREPEIRVFIGDPRRIRERNPAPDHPGQILVGVGQLLVAPGIVFGKSGGVRQQVPDGEAGRIRGRIFERLEFGDVPLGRIIQGQPAFVPQLEDGGRREALGHRGDPEHGSGVHGRTGRHFTEPRYAGVDQPAVDDDPVCHAGHVGLLGEVANQPVDLGERGAQFGQAVGIGETGLCGQGTGPDDENKRGQRGMNRDKANLHRALESWRCVGS